MYYLIIIVIMLCLGFIFSGSEIGLYSVNRLRLASRAEAGRAGARRLQRLIRQPRRTINTILIANNVTHYVATACCAALLIRAGLGRRADFYSTLMLAPVLVVFTEIAPKVLFLRRADFLMHALAPWLQLVEFLFMPVLGVLFFMNKALSSLTGGSPPGFHYHITPEKMRTFFSHGVEAGVVSDYQHRIMDNVLRVKKISVQKALVPLSDAVMVNESAPYYKVRRVLQENNYSRIPVFSERRENITGMINLIDMVSAVDDEDNISDIVRTPVYVNAKDSVAHALYLLQRSSLQMAVVLNDSGEAAGICTVKDLVEEIVGELYDW